jgi:hypothetical protein
VLWKTLLYSILASLALIGEEMAPLMLAHGNPAPAWRQYQSEIAWPRF